MIFISKSNSLHFTSVALAARVASVAMATSKRGQKTKKRDLLQLSLEHKHHSVKGDKKENEMLSKY